MTRSARTLVAVRQQQMDEHPLIVAEGMTLRNVIRVVALAPTTI